MRPEERIERLQERARRLETAVADKETSLAQIERGVRHHPAAAADDFSSEDALMAEVSDMYVNMIRTKLQLLQALGRAAPSATSP